jgi:hypothetical protein
MYLSKSDKLARIPANRWREYTEMTGQEACNELRPIINDLIDKVNFLIDHGMHLDDELDRRPRELTSDEEG